MPAHQPCDACGAHSRATFALKSGNILTLCLHHAKEHADAIEQYLDEVFYDDPTEAPSIKPGAPK